MVEAAEFGHCLSVDDKMLVKDVDDENNGQSFVIWKWNWQDNQQSDIYDDADGSDDETNHSYPEGSKSDTGSDFDSSLVTYSVIFKCVGRTKELHVRSQEVLAKAAEKESVC